MTVTSASQRNRSKLRLGMQWAGWVLLLGGFATLLWCGIRWYRAWNFQKQAKAYLDQAIENRSALPAPSAHPQHGAVLGQIDIPRIGVSSIIVEGDDEPVLSLGVGHIRGTALPGSNGNIALAGHRDTVFRALRNIRKNDRILLVTPRQTYLYQVAWTRVVPPEDVGVLDDTGRPALTLVTCYPFNYIGAAPNRFIVRAERVDGS